MVKYHMQGAGRATVILHIYPHCHRTASDTNYWTIRTLFIAMTTLRMEESTPAEEFSLI